MKQLYDGRGIALGTGSADAARKVESALWRMMSFYDTPLADLDAAIEADPRWLLPHVMKAGFMLSLTEASLVDEARRILDHAATLDTIAPVRERAHLVAVQHAWAGRWHDACRLWDQILIAQPRDALALQWAHLWDFYRGDASNLRQRPARALPEWDETDPLYPYVLALYAFGLEENNVYPQAEELGRRAVASGAGVAWALHAVAHVMEMQGRYDEGSAWLRNHQREWAAGNGFAGHLWWHSGLFRLEGLDSTGTLDIVDTHLSGAALQITLQRLDAAALLWRLHLIGIDVGPRWQALASGWDYGELSAGHYAFNDMHGLLALLGSGDIARAERWLQSVVQRAELSKGDNRQMAREVGVPLMRGLLAFAREDFDVAVDMLYPVRALAQRFGGSHAQRDLVDQTLLAAAANGSQLALGRALLNERRVGKPPTPLTLHWARRLHVRHVMH